MDKLQKETPLQKILNYDEIINLTSRCLKYRYTMGGIGRKSISQAIVEIKSFILSQLDIPLCFKDVSFDNFVKKENSDTFNSIKKVVDEDLIGKVSMVFWSKDLYGVGKTHLLYAMAKEYALSDKRFNIKQRGNDDVLVDYIGSSICILSEYDFLNQIKDTFKPNSEKSEGDIFARLNKFDVICLDDVVKYTPSNLDFYQRVMFQLIDERYKKQKSIVITTNKNLVELGEYFGMATADRLKQMTKDCRFEFHGKTHRIG